MNDCGKLVTQLIEGGGIDLQEQVYLGCTVLHIAVECDHEDVVRRLVTKQRLTAAGGTGSSIEWTPLHIAAKGNNVAILGYILNLANMDVNEKDVDGSIVLHVNDGQTALHAAARNSNAGIPNYF
ncbi:ankyrin repeat-containing domain protein [Trichophaea hybrida]|nr:ankyrin repeat-containing domain protein [Trichophaea hybrida]